MSQQNLLSVPSLVDNNIQNPILNPIRSNSCVENKYKCVITSERLTTLKKNVETAIKDHKVFTIKGGWAVVRNQLKKRNWIEKIEQYPKIKHIQQQQPSGSTPEDLVNNLPQKQDWESQAAYVDKCEKTIMSRMLQNYDVDLYWSMRKEQSDLAHRGNVNKLINRFSRTLFASKEGLALLLQQHKYWCTEPGISQINFPRCYVLGFPDHLSHFVEDFRLTACMGLLKWVVKNYDQRKTIYSVEGQIQTKSIHFAMDRCSEYIESQKHLDLDKDFHRIWDHEWDYFLSNYYQVLHENSQFSDNDKTFPLGAIYGKSKILLREMERYWPNYCIDGLRNIWILKPGNKCRGRGIQLIKHLEDVQKIMGHKVKYVVQKYIERPLLIYNTKFDIRQWFIVASTQPLVIWMYKECYLRFSTQIFNLDNFHESFHLTNHAIQCKYTNMEERDKALPSDNMWDCHTFQSYLKQIGYKEKWEQVVYPGIKQSIICAMLSSQDVMDRRQNTFELYGADFMISENFLPWLIEINCCPDLSYSTSVTKRMCPQCLEDLIKVVIDRRRDPNAETGNFELIYRQNLPRIPPYLGTNLLIRGRRIFKNRYKTKLLKQQQKNEQIGIPLKYELLKTPLTEVGGGGDIYTGPIIEDLIDDLKNNQCEGSGVNFITATTVKVVEKKKRNRVAKKGYLESTSVINQNFVCRRPSKENINKYNNGLLWNKSVSVLKGKNILNNKI